MLQHVNHLSRIIFPAITLLASISIANADIKTITAARYHPLTGLIYYTVLVQKDDFSKISASEIWSVDRKSGKKSQVTKGFLDDIPAFDDSGSRMVFVRRKSNDDLGDIVVMDLKSKKTTQITQNSRAELNPFFFSDQELVFQYVDGPIESEIVLKNLTSGVERMLVQKKYNAYGPTRIPKTDTIIFSTVRFDASGNPAPSSTYDRILATLSLTGSDITPFEIKDRTNLSSIRYSVDGKTAIYSTTQKGSGTPKLYLYQPETMQSRQIDGLGYFVSMDLNSDSTEILCVGAPGRTDPSIWIFDVAKNSWNELSVK